MSEAFDCLSCGACCKESGPVRVEPEDRVPRRLTRSVRNAVGFDPFEAALGVRKMAFEVGGRCVALRGEIGVSCRCGIYDNRPAICREVQPGSQQCLISRAVAEHKRKVGGCLGYGPRPVTTAT